MPRPAPPEGTRSSKRVKTSNYGTATLSVNETLGLRTIIKSDEHSPPEKETATQESLTQWASALSVAVAEVAEGWPDMEGDDRIMAVVNTVQERIDFVCAQYGYETVDLEEKE